MTLCCLFEDNDCYVVSFERVPYYFFAKIKKLDTMPGYSYVGLCCSIPLKIILGTEHVDCIYEGRGRCWCGTTYNVDVDNQWGFCPCASSTIKGQWGAWTVWTPCKCGEIKFRSRPCNTIVSYWAFFELFFCTILVELRTISESDILLTSV